MNKAKGPGRAGPARNNPEQSRSNEGILGNIMNNWESQEQPDQPEAIWNNLEHMMDNSGIWWKMVNNTEYAEYADQAWPSLTKPGRGWPTLDKADQA